MKGSVIFSLNYRCQSIFVLLFLSAFPSGVFAADIIEVTPLTNKIIMLHFDEGSMTYPNELEVVRLNITSAANVSSYSITSTDDTDFSTAINPVTIGRKSKGTEFVSNSGVPWGGSSFDPTSKPWASEHWLFLQLEKPMKTGKSYTIHTGSIAKNDSTWTFTFDEKVHRSEAVHVNTLGYSPDKPKYGYVYQWMGDKGSLELAPYSGKKFWLIKDGETEPVFEGTLTFRAAANAPETGQPNDTPNRNFLGAEVYQCDFSSVSEPGNYHLSVEGIGSSYPFVIGDDAIFDAYYHGARTLYHQRSGIRLNPPYTDEGYVRPVNQNTKVTSDDGTPFAGQMLYCTLPYVEWNQGEGGGSSLEAIRTASLGNTLDVAGWYHDAGDWDGYFSHQRIPILLMLTYESFPERFMDSDLNIPESGNGIPDLIDEASWLIKFNYRLRKELSAKGYSNGGIGGARVAPDFFSAIDGNAESNKPSWKDHRRYVVSSADAYMTYLYAGQAAQFAYILKSLGRDPENSAVEMLDHVDFAQMSYDTISWVKEAIESYAWASDPANQPSKHAHYSSQLGVYKMYAAAALFRLTGDEVYHLAAKDELNKIKSQSSLAEDERYGAYTYLLTNNVAVDKDLKEAIKNVALSNADFKGMNAAKIRGLRWGGDYGFPMLVGQATTPWIFEALFAYGITGEEKYANTVHSTADYFLGTNPLHTTWMTGVGPRPAQGGFHLDTRYLWDNNWTLYKGFIPYGPWSMNYDFNPSTWTIDGVEIQGGAGPWNKDWANFSMYPLMHDWPGHERYNNNIHAPMSTENTVHQQSVYAASIYGFVNNRKNNNTDAPVKVGYIELDQTEITFLAKGDQDVLNASIDKSDASFPALAWNSSDPRIVHVDGFGRITAVSAGTATITCETLDGSVKASCEVTNDWEDTEVISITILPETAVLFEGQTLQLNVTFDPPTATNQFIDWSYSTDGIAVVNETGQLAALAEGMVWVIGTSMKDQKIDSVEVQVQARVDHVIADFDSIIPVTTEPQPDSAQVYYPEGAGNIAASNPYKGSANESELVLEWNRPAGDWRLMGMVLPTDFPQDLSKYSQFQFKYFGADIKHFLIQIQTVENTQIEINVPASGENCWKLHTVDLNSSLNMKQFNVFVNPTGNSQPVTFYFDDFILAGNPAIPFNQLAISQTTLELTSTETFPLQASNDGNPFSWVSSNPAVATVDHQGLVTAVGGGIAEIKAVALYGNTAVCEVIVDGGIYQPPTSKIILDFESIILDWNPYGAYAWGSDKNGITDNPFVLDENPSAKVFKWERDGTNAWAGFGIQFPEEETKEWDTFVFQAGAATKQLDGIRFVFRRGEDEIAAIEFDNLAILPGQWGTVSFSVSKVFPVDTTFTGIIVQGFKGTETVDVFYFDNFYVDKLPYVEVEGIIIDGDDSYTLDLNQTLQLNAQINPADATNSEINWKSNKENIASVSATGLVTAISVGEAIITAEAVDNPAIKASVTIIVLPTRINEMVVSDIKIFPNPSAGSFSVRSSLGIDAVGMYDHMGKLVFSMKSKGKNLISVDNINTGPGLYFIHVKQSNGSIFVFKKIVVSE
jgi:endoglucanase